MDGSKARRNSYKSIYYGYDETYNMRVIMLKCSQLEINTAIRLILKYYMLSYYARADIFIIGNFT